MDEARKPPGGPKGATMKFMMLVTGDKDYEAGKPPSPELMAAIDALAQKDVKAGRLVDSGGLLPTSHGARVRASGGKVTVKDGPFTEAKEVVGGYAIMEFASKEEALAAAREFMEVHARVLGPSYEGTCEVRPLAQF
jgi:hypothetical protein